jgi:hypothetical protein
MLVIGKVGGTWAVRVLRGREVLATEIIGELDPNVIVTVAQSAIALPSYSPYHIVRAVSPLIREAKTGYVPPPLGSSTRSAAETPIQPTQPTQPVQSAQPEQETQQSQQVQPTQQAEPIQPAESIQSDEAREEQDSPLLSRIIGQHVKEALNSSPPPPRPVEQVVTVATPRNVPQPKPAPLEKQMAPKRLELKTLKPEELVDRTFSTLMRQLETVMVYVYNNYGEKSASRLWEYMVDVAELVQAKRKNESLEDFITRRVEEDRILRVEYEVVEFREDRFVGRVKKCGLKQSVAETAKLTGRLLQDLPCMLCESTWKGTCRAMGFQLEYSRDKDGCTIKVQKPASKK